MSVRGDSVPAAPSTPANVDEIAAVVYRFAAENGDPDPASVSAAYADGVAAEKLFYDPKSPNGVPGQVIVVVARGNFTVYSASRPRAAAPPTGSELHLVLDVATLAVKLWGVSNSEPDLSSIGSPFAVPRP